MTEFYKMTRNCLKCEKSASMTWEGLPTGRRGRQPGYSDAAIQTCLTLKVLFGFVLRQTTGFVESLLRLVGLELSRYL